MLDGGKAGGKTVNRLPQLVVAQKQPMRTAVVEMDQLLDHLPGHLDELGHPVGEFQIGQGGAAQPHPQFGDQLHGPVVAVQQGTKGVVAPLQHRQIVIRLFLLPFAPGL